MGGFDGRWSNDSQLWWTGAKPGDAKAGDAKAGGDKKEAAPAKKEGGKK